MEFSIVLDADDWKAFMAYMAKWLRLQKRFSWSESLKNVILWMVIGVIAVGFLRNGFDVHWPSVVVTSIIFSAIGIIWLVEMGRNQVILQPEMGCVFIGEHRFRFDEEGIHSSGSHYQSTHRWSAVKRVARDNGLVLLFIDKAYAFSFPEKKLPDPDMFFKFVVERTKHLQHV